MKKLKIAVGVLVFLLVFKVCIDIEEDVTVENEDMYSNVKKNVKKRNQILTVDQTNQEELRKKHKSKYESKGRIIEPIGDMNE